MRIGRLIVLAVVVVLVGAYIVFVERHQPTTDELKEREGKLFPTFDRDKAEKLVITNSHGRFELVKEKGAWKLTAPLADDANTGAVTSVLFALADLKSQRALDAKGLKLAEYGLDKPPFEVSVESAGGGKSTLKVGSELPLGDTRAAETGDGKVYLVQKYIASDLDKDLAGWRSDQLAQIYAADVASLTVASPIGQVALAHAGSVWTMTAPTQDIADRDRAEGVVTDISAARIKEFVDKVPDLKALGLEPPKYTVTIVRRAADAAPIVLAFGNERTTKDGQEEACKRGERVFWVDAKAASRLGAPWAEWRSTKLVQFDTWAATKLEIAAGSSKADLESKSGVWKAGSTEVDGEAVSRRLATLSEMTVKAFDRPKPSGAPLGSVKVSGEGFAIDAAFYPGSGPGDAVALVAGRTGGLAVDGAKVRELLADPSALARPKPTPTPLATAAPKASVKATPAVTPKAAAPAAVKK